MVLSLINVSNKISVINVKRAMEWTRGILNCECAMCVGIDPLLLERISHFRNFFDTLNIIIV